MYFIVKIRKINNANCTEKLYFCTLNNTYSGIRLQTKQNEIKMTRNQDKNVIELKGLKAELEGKLSLGKTALKNWGISCVHLCYSNDNPHATPLIL